MKRKKIEIDDSVKMYLIMPHEHGNGGWCGSEILAHITPKWMLKRNPVQIYLDGYYDPMFGSALRLCSDTNPNNAVYLYDHENYEWLDGDGYPLQK